MDRTSLIALADDLLAQAREAHAGRAASTLHPFDDGRIRQTVIAMTAGTALSDHESPGEATLQVLRGDVRLTWAGDALDLAAGDFAPIPPQRHGLEAAGDAVVLLTVALD
jgi:quercetin dioxygenase-like cupin family protein